MLAFDSRVACGMILLCVVPVFGQSANQPVEPNAGAWKTWAISSGKDYRVPPPPDAANTQNELAWLRGVVLEPNPYIADGVRFWGAGAPAYQWFELITKRILSGAPVTGFPHRVYTYVALAMYDATVAAWESKYFYNRPRPSQLDPTLKTRLPTPQSPSYPSEHATTAAAAATVLAYFFPDEAATFQSMAEEAGKTQLYAGLAFPTDYFAGMDLGRKVAQRVIEVAKADGSDAVFTGAVPTGKCMWIGSNPANVTATMWKPFLLAAPSEFRPDPPPACDSPQMSAEVALVRDTPRSPAAFATNSRAMYWQSPEGLNFWQFMYANKFMFEDKLDQNPPRWARTYALLVTSFFDTFIANQDGKYTYWYIRPSQLDTSIVPLFPVPNHPSYPSNHAAFSTSRGEILAYLFPQRADFIRALAKEAGDSRIWAGIHYPNDLVGGNQLGNSVAQKFIAWASKEAPTRSRAQDWRQAVESWENARSSKNTRAIFCFQCSVPRRAKTSPFLHALSASGNSLLRITGSRLFFVGFLHAGVQHRASGSCADSESHCLGTRIGHCRSLAADQRTSQGRHN